MTLSPVQLAEEIRHAFASVTVADVRSRAAIGALLAAHPGTLDAVSQALGLTTRTLRQCIELHLRYTPAELDDLLALRRPPSFSALVLLGGMNRSRRAPLLRAWLARPSSSVRELARAVRRARARRAD